jgi:hypothetical protein
MAHPDFISDLRANLLFISSHDRSLEFISWFVGAQPDVTMDLRARLPCRIAYPRTTLPSPVVRFGLALKYTLRVTGRAKLEVAKVCKSVVCGDALPKQRAKLFFHFGS